MTKLSDEERRKLEDCGLMSPNLVRLMQRFVANASITQSAVRQGRGHSVQGVMHAAIGFLSELDTSKFADPDSFTEALNSYTCNLKDALPDGGQYWGRARKCLNIFLREASYNFLLRTTYGLGNIDALLETPLDSRVAKGLMRDAGKGRLPRWTSIIALTPEQNATYQAVAAEVAKGKYSTLRANLDLWYYRPE
jgi:hypothetical protein